MKYIVTWFLIKILIDTSLVYYPPTEDKLGRTIYHEPQIITDTLKFSKEFDNKDLAYVFYEYARYEMLNSWSNQQIASVKLDSIKCDN